MPVTNPLSSRSPVGSGAEADNQQKEGIDDTLDSVPRTVAGVVNERGEIVDKSGIVIGSVADLKDHDKLVGGAVTEKGDVVSDLGESLANVHIDDNYTPTHVPEKKEAGGWNVLGKAKTAMQYGDSIRNVVSYGQNIQSTYNKFSGGQRAGEDQMPAPVQMEHKDSGLKSQVDRKKGEAEKSAAEEKSTAGSRATAGEAGKHAEQADSLVAQSPESLEETTEATTAGQGAPKESVTGDDDDDDDNLGQDNTADVGLEEGQMGTDKLDQGRLQETKPDEDPLDQTKNVAATDKLEQGQLSKDDLGDDTLDKPNPDEDTLGQVKDEATGKAEQDQPLEDKVDKETLGEARGEASGHGGEGSQLSKDDLGKDMLGEAPDKATDNAQEGQLGEHKLGQDKLEDETKPDEDTLGQVKDDVTSTAEQDQAREDKVDKGKGTPGEAQDEATDKVEQGAEEAGEAAAKALDLTILKGTKVNKAGNLVNDSGDMIGRLVDGDPKKLIGKTADEEGQIWNESGKVVGKAEPMADAERDEAAKDFAPFENFPDAIVEGDGRVLSEGRQVGEVIEGDAKRMKGSRVDEDGDILDRRGNVIGKARPWDEPEQVPEEAVDMSSLAGKRVNKAGNVVDAHGRHIFGRVIEGNVKALVGRMCDKEGNVMSESGEKIGRAELVPESEREASRDSPFAHVAGCTVSKDGKVVTSSGEVVGRLTSGDGKALHGRSVDEDGDVVDKNGNVLGQAERWEEPEVERKRDPLAGRRVNREGHVVDEDGNVIGKLVSGDVSICSGKEVDDDGDVVNSKGNTIGHVSLVEDMPPEPEESAQDKEKREQAEKDRKLAGQLAASIEQSLDKIKPILRMITDKVDKAERTPREELDEEQLVREVKPLIEEGSKILTETNGLVRGMDPDGRIQRQAKHKASTKEATPEEHHLAEVLKELAGDVTHTIDNAKRKIDGMPHAKKELNPLWGLLSEPLFQIIAAVGLLLNGVLSLVGRLLSGLGLGGLVDNLLGTLGLNKVLDGLGLGSVTSALTGKKDKK